MGKNATYLGLCGMPLGIIAMTLTSLDCKALFTLSLRRMTWNATSVVYSIRPLRIFVS